MLVNEIYLEGNCNVKIKISFMLEIDSSSCIHDRKVVLDFKLSLRFVIAGQSCFRFFKFR